jgi:hypothetical protein
VIGALQFDDECIVHEDIGEIIPYALAFVIHTERSLRDSRNGLDLQLSEQGAFVDLFEKSSAEFVGNLEDSA